ncbi:MAG: DUF1326 domain-containing protein [Candidatus Eremiobacteraeota bacterium]|nr:DUF1326 domain-containing protein [Candidatus Eremiobacteraeota bacterium]MBV8365192.1 DUF1326 domain-containing protein [Candidatus Eremiobacteraeota bacterium]
MATQTQPQAKTAAKTYVLQGTILEACSCRTLCRCWIGEDPDGGACDAFLAYNITKGEINGIDVSGLTFVGVVKIPGNVLVPKSWSRVTFVDNRARPEQKKALLDAFQGRLGGPLGDLSGLVKEDLASYDVPIEHKLVGGEGTISVGDKIHAKMAPYKSAYGTATTLRDSIFSTIAGAPAYVSKASEHFVNIPEHGMVWTFKDRNAIQGDFRFEA